jgi:exosortase
MKTKPTDPLLLAAAVLTLIYAALWTFAPRLICAAVAITALACSWVSLIGARSKLPAVVVLFVLSLPVLASLQFYLGYPLRATTAAGATWLLHVIGFDVERSGAVMRWQEHVVLVDAPCSGVRMLWAAAFLSCILAMQRRFVRWPAMIGLLLLAVPIVLVANMVRAAALFTFEIQPQPASAVLHALIGVSAFGLTAVAIVAVDRMLRRTPARVRVSR